MPRGEPAIRRADPHARRRAAVLIVALGCIGALLIAAAGSYRDTLRDWILAGPQAAPDRIEALLRVAIVLTVTPLFAFGIYVWRLGMRVSRDRVFPPEGQRVLRDTLIVTGDAAAARGARLKCIGVTAIAAAALLALALWHTLRWR
jgi:hypothetical protein